MLYQPITTAADDIFILYYIVYFAKKISIYISSESSASQFTWNDKTYFYWK